jgi:Leucine-rich repeat (LRR) protein
LSKLRRLDVQSNRLTTINNIIHTSVLEELYLAHNAITTDGALIVSGLQQNFPNLSVLDLCRNKITNTKPFEHLLSLKELWMSGNLIESLDTDVEPYMKQLAKQSTSQTIYLEYNPIQKDPLYRKKLTEIVSCLTQIDAYFVYDTKLQSYPIRHCYYYYYYNDAGRKGSTFTRYYIPTYTSRTTTTRKVKSNNEQKNVQRLSSMVCQ